MIKIAHIFPCHHGIRGGLLHYPLILNKALSEFIEVEPITEEYFPFSIAASLAGKIKGSGCDAAILEYTPNLYGWSNLFPCRILEHLRRNNVRTLSVIHEIFMPYYPTFAGKFVMRPINFYKDKQVLFKSDISVVTFGHRAISIKKRYGIDCPVLPAFSCIPPYTGPIKKKTHLMGIFGTQHHDLQIDRILSAARILGTKALFIGGFKGLQEDVTNLEITGFLPDAEVSEKLQCLKYFIVCDKRGISFRKSGAAAAFMSGLPVIANRTDWTDSVFRHGENLYFHDGSAEGIVNAVRKLEADPSLAEKIGIGGKNLYLEYMSSKKIALKMIDLFKGKKCA